MQVQFSDAPQNEALLLAVVSELPFNLNPQDDVWEEHYAPAKSVVLSQVVSAEEDTDWH